MRNCLASQLQLLAPALRRSGLTRWRRRGMILAAVLATLAVVALLGAALTRSLVLQVRHMGLSEQRQQALWLAESAMQRGLHSLAASREYQGEAWNVAPDLLGAGRSGSATIQVELTTEPESGAWIRVEVRYPDDPLQRFVYNRELFVPFTSPGASP